MIPDRLFPSRKVQFRKTSNVSNYIYGYLEERFSNATACILMFFYIKYFQIDHFVVLNCIAM